MSTNNSIFFAQSVDDYVVAGVWAALCAFGLASNFLISLAIWTNRKLRKSVSYWLIVSLAFCDCCMLAVSVAHILPETIKTDQLRIKQTEESDQPINPQKCHQNGSSLVVDYGNVVAIFVYDASWYAGVFHLMLMALNRYVNICTPNLYAAIFTRKMTRRAVAGAYVLGVGISAPSLHSKKFYAAEYVPPDTPYAYADLLLNATSIVVMVVCYSKIILRVRRSRIALDQYKQLIRHYTVHSDYGSFLDESKSAKRLRDILKEPSTTIASYTGATSRRELRLFFQFFSVSLIFFLSFATWNWLPKMSGSRWVGFTVTTLFFVNNCINPVVYLIFNDMLRRQLMRICCNFPCELMNKICTCRNQETSFPIKNYIATEEYAINRTVDNQHNRHHSQEKPHQQLVVPTYRQYFLVDKSADYSQNSHQIVGQMIDHGKLFSHLVVNGGDSYFSVEGDLSSSSSSNDSGCTPKIVGDETQPSLKTTTTPPQQQESLTACATLLNGTALTNSLSSDADARRCMLMSASEMALARNARAMCKSDERRWTKL
uniref:G-protein coupled receptors family 1 profile domain-containing protein n=1 Tax=Romanomermis culicivorax TaxID=13658 RepID=A0A915KBD3_ROMCU